MKKASLTETKNRLSALIDEVREGESILVLDRGRPVARIESVVGDQVAPPGRLERLERKGLVRRASKPGSAPLEGNPPKLTGEPGALQALLGERETGR